MADGAELGIDVDARIVQRPLEDRHVVGIGPENGIDGARIGRDPLVLRRRDEIVEGQRGEQRRGDQPLDPAGAVAQEPRRAEPRQQRHHHEHEQPEPGRPADRPEGQHVRVEPQVEPRARHAPADLDDWAEREQERGQTHRAQHPHPLAVGQASVAHPRAPAAPADERILQEQAAEHRDAEGRDRRQAGPRGADAQPAASHDRQHREDDARDDRGRHEALGPSSRRSGGTVRPDPRRRQRGEPQREQAGKQRRLRDEVDRDDVGQPGPARRQVGQHIGGAVQRIRGGPLEPQLPACHEERPGDRRQRHAQGHAADAARQQRRRAPA